MTTKAQDRKHAETYRSPFGRWDVTAPAYMASPAVVEAPLRAVSAAYAAGLRAGHTPVPPRPGREQRAAETQARVRAAIGTPAVKALPGTPVETRESKRERFARLDAMAAAIPDGRYALPRRSEAGDGQSVYFFQVKGKRIIMLTGGVGAFAQHSMNTTYQEVALTKIAADPRAAAVLFGHSTSTCGRCNSPLTNDASVARGLGPDCAKHY